MSIKKNLLKDTLSREDIVQLLSVESQEDIELLRSKAYETMLENVGDKVYLRGLIEFSNYCVNDCYYCGIRRSNSNTERYRLTVEQVIEAARLAAEFDYGSVVLQSGDRRDEQFIEYVISCIKGIKDATRSEKYPEGLGITLCVGEQTEETYRKFFDAGAHRYLLRIETTNPELFAKIHPPQQLLETRIEALNALKKVGFQVGTGVMIGLPGQTFDDLANDVLFFREMDMDMIGMGPYLPHNDTPMGKQYETTEEIKKWRFQLSLKMIAVCRIVLKDVNIASTTALQTIHPTGREEGLRYGANVIMPQITPTEYRKNYMLYEDKPCVSEFAAECHSCMQMRIASVGRSIAYGVWGDPLHFQNKRKN